MSKRVPKIASAAIKNRAAVPIMQWIRSRLMAVERNEPAGLPGPDGKSQYFNPCRFPNDQAARAKEMPLIPGGVHHRISEVNYFERDGRRRVQPPQDLAAQTSEGEQVLKSPEQNYGLTTAAPTPGAGFEWTRSIKTERDTQREDPTLKKVENYDRYLRA